MWISIHHNTRKEGRKDGWMDEWMDEILYVERKYCLVMVVSYVLTLCRHLLTFVRHCLEFSFEFSAPLPVWRNLYSPRGTFCGGGRYQPGCTGILWPAEGTSQPVTISKKCKNPSSALRRTRTCCVQGPSPILSSHHVPYLCRYLDTRWWMRLITLFPCLPIIPYMLVLRFL